MSVDSLKGLETTGNPSGMVVEGRNGSFGGVLWRKAPEDLNVSCSLYRPVPPLGVSRSHRQPQATMMLPLLHIKPQIYTDMVSRPQSTRHAWSRSESLPFQQQDDLKTLRVYSILSVVLYSQYSN
ncbi:hypothetical protein BDQ17DRAFT_1368532 [Cyathus striatus]|nr:hypothetical protein BDQ17DRAFT_1368532 [Cyathus striatus]